MKYLDAEVRELRDQDYNLFHMNLFVSLKLLDITQALHGSNKFAMEMMSTFILACMLQKSRKRTYRIGFPCKKGRISGIVPTDIEFLKTIAIERSEIDTVLVESSIKRFRYTKLQIVRCTRQSIKDTKGLYDFINEKKLSKYPKDDSLHLLVNIEDALRFKYADLNGLLCESAVPFASIVLVSHLGPITKPRFAGVIVYPRIEGPVELDFSKPPPG